MAILVDRALLETFRFVILVLRLSNTGWSLNGLVSYAVLLSGLKAGGLLVLSIIGIAPHPPIIIPAIGRGEIAKASKTVDGLKQLSLQVKESAPELLVLITPHGQALREGPSILTGERLVGNFGQFGFPGIEVEFQTDQGLVDLVSQETAAEAIKPIFLDDRSNLSRSGKTLDHGAMVPLYYLQEAGVDIPGLHITSGFNTYRQLYQFGRALRRAIDRRGLPAAVLASGDLSHRLIPGAPAGYNPRGTDFDHLLVELLRDGKIEEILNIDPDLVEDAGECGLRAFVIALGTLDNISFTSEIISYEGPFGVGYLVAALYPKPEVSVDSAAGEKFSDAEERVGFHPAEFARTVLQSYLQEGRMPAFSQQLPPEYKDQAGVFVSLKKDGHLRGCIGTVSPVRDNLAEEIAANAVSAALNDPRFPPVSMDELAELTLSVDILGPMEKVNKEGELDPKRYGVLVRSGVRSGLLLPDLEGVDTIEEQVGIARQKAGITPGSPIELYRFKVTRYPEK